MRRPSCRHRLPFALAALGLAAGAYGLSRAARRQGMSARLLLVRSALGLGRAVLKSEEATRRQVEGRAYPTDARLPLSLRARCTIHERVIDGQRVVTLVPRSGRANWHILYLHGGAYINPLVSAHWSIIAKLIRETGASVTVPFYALAPENDHRPGTALVDALVDEFAATHPGTPLFLAGDSAGGNFALGLAIRRRDAGKPLPSGLILLSPWLDLELRDRRMREGERDDVMLGVEGLRLCGRWWAGAADPGSPAFSPVRADPSGLPPIAVFQGDRDLFVIDARSFAEVCQRAGVECLYREYPGAFHVFMGATFTPEAHDVFRRIAAFVDRASQRRPAIAG